MSNQKNSAREMVDFIRRVVKEEISRQLPGLLSEMYLKKLTSSIINENTGPVVNIAENVKQNKKPENKLNKRSFKNLIAENMGFSEDDGEDYYNKEEIPTTQARTQIKEKFMVGGVNILEGVDTSKPDEAPIGQDIESFGLDFSKMAKAAGINKQQNKPSVDENFENERLRRLRERLEVEPE